MDLVTFTEEILNEKLHFFVQCTIHKIRIHQYQKPNFQKSPNLLILEVVEVNGLMFLAIIFHILFTNNYTTYLDENECETSNGGCQHQCENINGSYFCHCNDGFFLDGNGKSCSGKREIKQGRVSSCHKFYGGGCYFLAFMNKTFH